MTLMLRYAARSDVGLIRDGNEDSFFAGPRLLAVADGMGGQAAGDVASRVVVTTLAALDEDVPGGDLVDALRKTIDQANQTLHAMVEGDADLEGMGTTLTAILFAGSRLALAHVGDSRAYLLRGDTLTQLTHDDTYVQSLVDDGQLTAEEASSHPQRSLLLRALTGTDVSPDLSIREALLGDRYLLCTDGLSGVVSEETMTEALQINDPQRAADRLIELALRGGGPDNISCVVADVIDSSLGDDQPVFGGAVLNGQDQGEPSADTPAGRAALTRPRRPRPAPPPEEEPPRRVWQWVALAVIGLLIIGGGFWLAWTAIWKQYYVGAATNGGVVVFQGVRGSVGISLHRVVRQSDFRLDDLEPVTRRQVSDGIVASSRADADHKLELLRKDHLLPLCPASTGSPPTGGKAPGPTARATASPGAAGARATTPSTVPTTVPTTGPSPTHTVRPGVDCRKPR